MKVIIGNNITNSRPTYKIEPTLTDNQRRSLFNWVMESVWPKIQDKKYFRYDLQVPFFIFDKPKFYQYVDDVKKMKNNYETYNSKDRLILKTDRIKELEDIIEYLNKKDRYGETFYYKDLDNVGEFKKFLEYFVNGIKFTKPERNSTITSLLTKSKKDMEKIIEDVFNIEYIPSTYNSKGYIKERGVKESIITNYSIFTTSR